MAESETTSRNFALHLDSSQAERDIQIFLFLARNASELRTENGLRLNEANDWRQFFREVAGALAERQAKENSAAALNRR